MVFEGPAGQGFGHEQLAKMRRIIDAEKCAVRCAFACGLCLAATDTGERAAKAKTIINTRSKSKQ